MGEAEKLALSAAGQASAAVAELVRFANEGPHYRRPFGDVEVIELLADGLKLAIETELAAERDKGLTKDEDRDQLLSALVRFLEGWA